jgi:UDP-N-acetylglucosamine 4-epimerase
MITLPPELATAIAHERRRWLVTGAACFIGSNIVECLLRHGQSVTGLDNLATGYLRNVDEALVEAGANDSSFTFVRGDIRDRSVC